MLPRLPTAGNERKNQTGYAFLRAKNAFLPSCISHTPCNRITKGKMEQKMNIKRIIYIMTGCIGVRMRAVGAVVPMLPAFPFFS